MGRERERMECSQWERQKVSYGTKEEGENFKSGPESAFVGGEVSLQNREGDGK